MLRVLSNVIEMFVYSAAYMVIVLVSLKIVGSIFTSDLEKKISEEANLGLAVICAAVFIGIGMVLSAVVR